MLCPDLLPEKAVGGGEETPLHEMRPSVAFFAGLGVAPLVPTLVLPLTGTPSLEPGSPVP